MAKEKTIKKTEVTEVNSEKTLKEIGKKMEGLTVNGLFLPEKEKKENLLQRSIYIKPSLYEKFYKLSKELDLSMNLIQVTLIEQFVNANTHLLKK